MKKFLTFALVVLALSAGAKITDNRVVGTNSVSINGVRFPLNCIALKISSDSTKVQFWTIAGYGNAYNYTPITQLDSFQHYYNNGTQFRSVSQVDSLYQAKFVK